MIKKLFTILALVSITSTMQASFNQTYVLNPERLGATLTHLDELMRFKQKEYRESINNTELLLMLAESEGATQETLNDLQATLDTLNQAMRQEKAKYQDIINQLESYMFAVCPVN